MGISVAHQTWAFLWSIAFGMGLGLLFDCFRILRLILPSPRWLVGLEDMAYCLLAAALCGAFLLRVNQGEPALLRSGGRGAGLGALVFHLRRCCDEGREGGDPPCPPSRRRPSPVGDRSFGKDFSENLPPFSPSGEIYSENIEKTSPEWEIRLETTPHPVV